MISFDEALARVIAIGQPLGVETIPFPEASGRVLAEAVTARFAMPRTDVSAMDGYAVRDADLCALPFGLPISGVSAAGFPPGQVLPTKAAMRIFTGAPLPEGADRVIVQESAQREGDSVTFHRSYGPSRHIRKAGSDFSAGDILVPAGGLLDWKSLTTAAAGDRGEVSVFLRPRVAIIATGDELADPGMAGTRPGAIPESVSYGIAALTAQQGGIVVCCERLPDQPARLRIAASQALADADLLIMIGGASVGDRDHSRSVFEQDLDYVFPKVAIKPGKPVWLARVGRRLVLGLPGNPTSALVTARLFLVPLLQGLSGRDPGEAVVFETMICSDPLPDCGDRETFLRARRIDGSLRLAVSQDSSGQMELATCDALIRLLPGTSALPAGTAVSFLPF